MANGYHLFSTGEVLTAANVNDYLMKQTVMIFASASARTTALSGVLREGMISYRLDSHVLEVYNGTIWEAPETNLTTKGDLATFDTAPTRLAVGSDGQTLVANSANSSGLGWSATPSASNPVLNSAFQIWQRGTSISIATSTPAYIADRWAINPNTNACTVSRQATADTTNLPNIQYCARVQRNAGQTATTTVIISQSFETINSIPYAGKTVTMSFYARAGANFSSAANALTVYLLSGTGTDQNRGFGSAYTGEASVINSQVATLTTTWQRFTFTGTVASNATELAPYLFYIPSGTAGAADYFEVTGVQIDVGSVALPFRTYAGTLQGELQACRRYLPAITNSGSSTEVANGYAYATNGTIYTIPFDTPARVAPTGATLSGTFLAYALNTGNTVTPTFSGGTINTATLLATPTIIAGQGSRLGLASGSILFTGCEL